MLSTSPVESPAAPDHKLDPGRIPVNGYQALRPEPDAGIATAGSVLSGVLGAAPVPVEAGLRMLGAAASDVAGALDGGPATDPLDERDPAYIRETLPALRLLSSLYFRADVRGLGNIPAAGPVLLVGNHSGAR